jgi:hypothetical protein
VARYRELGVRGLVDRSSAPHVVANRTPNDRIEATLALRRLRFSVEFLLRHENRDDPKLLGEPARLEMLAEEHNGALEG